MEFAPDVCRWNYSQKRAFRNLKAGSSMKQHVAIIIGVGPAGLTAAYELLKRTNIKPIVLERSEYMGGIAERSSTKAIASMLEVSGFSPSPIA